MRRLAFPLTAIVCTLGLTASSLRATEIVVRNDSLEAGDPVSVQAGFVAGESAASWLTAPCGGNIVAIQIFWKSQFGGANPTLEDSITLYHASSFPFPGAVMTNGIAPFQPVILEGPVLEDGVFNEFRYLDEQSTVPIQVPVQKNDVFIVSFKFYNSPDPFNGPSICTDTTGCAGDDLNALHSGTWIDVCSAFPSISGDWIIRAVIDCQDPTGACCNADAVCLDNVDQSDCQAPGMTFFPDLTCAEVTCPTPKGACCNGTGGCLVDQTQDYCENTLGGIYAGNGTQCSDGVCDLGACCLPDGSCQEVIELACADLDGQYFGAGSACASTNCPQPTGACCINENCVPGQTEADCQSFSGTWQGMDTTCDPNPCVPQACHGDASCDGQIDFDDINPFVDAVVSGTYCDGTGDNADVNADGMVDFDDVNPFVVLLTTNTLPIACD